MSFTLIEIEYVPISDLLTHCSARLELCFAATNQKIHSKSIYERFTIKSELGHNHDQKKHIRKIHMAIWKRMEWKFDQSQNLYKMEKKDHK